MYKSQSAGTRAEAKIYKREKGKEEKRAYTRVFRGNVCRKKGALPSRAAITR